MWYWEKKREEPILYLSLSQVEEDAKSKKTKQFAEKGARVDRSAKRGR